MELAGLGALMAMLDARKKRLAAEGLFDAARKKPIPFLPQIVGVITSPTGAVIRDIMHRLSDRCPRHVLLWPVTVQGERAPAKLPPRFVASMRCPQRSGAPPRCSNRGAWRWLLEDLLAFSDETVVRAAAESSIPLISAVDMRPTRL
jgi:exodeoxyribonuclease VII large subunit